MVRVCHEVQGFLLHEFVFKAGMVQSAWNYRCGTK